MKFNFEKILGVSAAVTVAAGAHAEGVNNNNKVESDSAVVKQMKDPSDSLGKIGTTAQVLKADEKFKEIALGKEVAGITVEGMLLISMPEDPSKEYYLVVFSGEGENLVGKELAGLKELGLEPASSAMLDKINPEAFNKVRKSVKAIDVTYQEGENLGQTRPMIVKENTVVNIRNAGGIQSTELDAMQKLGTTFDYATIAYKNKDQNKTGTFPTGDLAINQ